MMTESPLRPTDIVELNPRYLFRWEEPQQAYILLYPEGLIKLNATAGEILGTIAAGPRAVNEIIAQFTAAYQDADVAKDVMEFLETSYDKGWIRTKS